MKYVAVLDIKNAASFFLHNFRCVETGEGAAIASSEGITFLRASNYSLSEQHMYFSEMHQELIRSGESGLNAGLIPAFSFEERPDFLPFCQGMKEISLSIKTICIGPAVHHWQDQSLDYYLGAKFPAVKMAVKGLLGIDPAYDDSVRYPESSFFARARQIRHSVCNFS